MGPYACQPLGWNTSGGIAPDVIQLPSPEMGDGIGGYTHLTVMHPGGLSSFWGSPESGEELLGGPGKRARRPVDLRDSFDFLFLGFDFCF